MLGGWGSLRGGGDCYLQLPKPSFFSRLHIYIYIGLGFNFYANGFYFYAVYCRVSLHLHVSILLSTRFFFMLICPFLMLPPSFSYAPWRRWDGGVSLHLDNLSFSYAAPLFFLCSMAQVGRGVSLHLHVSILSSTRFFFMLICPFLMLPPSFSYATYAPWRRWDRGSPSISMSPSCCRHVSFLMLICPFLMLPPSFSYATYAQVGRGVSLHLHVSILLSTRFFFYSNLSFSYAAPLFFLCNLCSMAQVGRGVSLHLHVSILLSTRFFFYANLSFSYAAPLFFLCNLCSMAQVARGVSLHLHVSILLSTRFFFYANLSFSYAAPSFSYVPRRRWDGARGTLVQDPTIFGAILYGELVFFNAAFVLFLCFMGRFPSISMCLPPFPCLPSCCRHVCFLMPTGFSLMRAVSPFMPSVSFLC